MKLYNLRLLIFLITLFTFSCDKKNKNEFESDDMIIRISEIEIDSLYINEYISILKEESEASIRLETGVISIYPMIKKENPNQIIILEIYENNKAYKSHLETPHFKHYKNTTLKMVKSLKLVDMKAIDSRTMPKIFTKLN